MLPSSREFSPVISSADDDYQKLGNSDVHIIQAMESPSSYGTDVVDSGGVFNEGEEEDEDDEFSEMQSIVEALRRECSELKVSSNSDDLTLFLMVVEKAILQEVGR